jgi:glutaredoxin
MLASLFSWWKRRGPRLGRLHVIVYTRNGCHLCEDAWRLLEKEQRRHGFQLSAVDVDADAELRARYGEQVPVVAVDGKVRFWGRINPVLLDRLLRAEQAQSAGGG